MKQTKVRRALLSVSDKTGLIDFAKRLLAFGVQLISTGGTAKLLSNAGLVVSEISEFTGFPEILDGRVKTLHPKVHGGLLFKRDNPEHERQAEVCGIAPIDMVVVNLYPFEKTIEREGVTLGEAIEQIDIGGPSMLRSAAKNYQSVTVVSDPADYIEVVACMEANEGATSLKLREKLAIKAFMRTSAYDHAITRYLDGAQQTASSFTLSLPLATRLRYGENPHQNAALYGDFSKCIEKIHGKELSYNNILDITAAVNLISEFNKPTVAILKHTNPCGVGSNDDLREAWELALATDRQAPFGGIIITNRHITEPLARSICEIFSEVIIAPGFEPSARALLQKKKNLRLMVLAQETLTVSGIAREVRSVLGGVLVQDQDPPRQLVLEERVVTKRPPTKKEIAAMHFGWKVVKHVKSNAIVIAGPDRTIGIGAGQMSRLDSARIAVWKAKEAGLAIKGASVASDAFFPFPDGLVVLAKEGVASAIQPGGSLRDNEVIEAANDHGMTMVFTGMRHFKH